MVKAAFSKGGKARFTWYAKHCLRKLNRLILPPEKKYRCLIEYLNDHMLFNAIHTTGLY